MGLGLTFDTGALIALERRRQRMTDVLRRAAQRAVPITVPAPVLGEWWRGQGGAWIRDLRACFDVEPMTERLALTAGEALARTKGKNLVDAVVVASAAQRGDIVYTADVLDLERLAHGFPGVRVIRC